MTGHDEFSFQPPRGAGSTEPDDEDAPRSDGSRIVPTSSR